MKMLRLGRKSKNVEDRRGEKVTLPIDSVLMDPKTLPKGGRMWEGSKPINRDFPIEKPTGLPKNLDRPTFEGSHLNDVHDQIENYNASTRLRQMKFQMPTLKKIKR